MTSVDDKHNSNDKNKYKNNNNDNVNSFTKFPVVFVNGFMGVGKRYWGPASSLPGVLFPELGPVSSLWDRSIELFYNIKGGTVDYGKEHCEKYGHKQFGRTYEGLYSNWSEENPIHLIGHSYGGTTIRYLQQLLEEKVFPGHNTSAKWIVSISTITAPHKGTTGTYILGEKESPPGKVHKLSFGSLLTQMIHIYEYLDSQFLKKYFIDFNLDHWQFSRKHVDISAPIKWLLSESGISQSTDNGAYDLTVHSMCSVNSFVKNFSHCFYRSYVLKFTKRLPIIGWHVPRITWNPIIGVMGFLVGRKTFKDGNLLCNNFNDSDWWESDGLAPVYSQCHPGECADGVCVHYNAFTNNNSNNNNGNNNVNNNDCDIGIECFGCNDSDEEDKEETYIQYLKNQAQSKQQQQQRQQQKQKQLQKQQSSLKPYLPHKPGEWQVLEMEGFGHFDVVPFPTDREFQMEFFDQLFDYLREVEHNYLMNIV